MGRAQSLATTVFVALYYLLLVLQNPREFPTAGVTPSGNYIQ